MSILSIRVMQTDLRMLIWLKADAIGDRHQSENQGSGKLIETIKGKMIRVDRLVPTKEEM